MDTNHSRIRKWLVTGALVAGVGVGAAGIANAASSSSTTPTTTATGSSATGSADANRPDPSTMTHGPNETLLTGDTASKVTAAALAKEPGATVIRVENDSSGTAPYEAHLRTSAGTEVTVYVGSDFTVTSTADGFGGGPDGRGGAMPGGYVPPSGASSSGSGA